MRSLPEKVTVSYDFILTNVFCVNGSVKEGVWFEDEESRYNVAQPDNRDSRLSVMF